MHCIFVALVIYLKYLYICTTITTHGGCTANLGTFVGALYVCGITTHGGCTANLGTFATDWLQQTGCNRLAAPENHPCAAV